jgi:hypothetical protein
MLVLTSAAAATEARLLVQRGLRQRDAPPTATSDILLTTPHGAQAFLLLRGDADASSIVARAATATRAARRCTILWLGERIQHSAVMALQEDWCVSHSPAVQQWHIMSSPTVPFTRPRSPFGVSVLLLENSGAAADHIASCARQAQAARAEDNTTADNEAESTVDGVAGVLSSMWGVDRHDVDFLLASTSLPALARLGTDAEFAALLDSTAGLVEPQLIEGAVRWLHDDAIATS